MKAVNSNGREIMTTQQHKQVSKWQADADTLAGYEAALREIAAWTPRSARTAFAIGWNSANNRAKEVAREALGEN